jgi:hypothetical protein
LRRNTRTNKRQGGHATLRNQTRMSSNFCHHDWTMWRPAWPDCTNQNKYSAKTKEWHQARKIW